MEDLYVKVTKSEYEDMILNNYEYELLLDVIFDTAKLLDNKQGFYLDAYAIRKFLEIVKGQMCERTYRKLVQKDLQEGEE